MRGLGRRLGLRLRHRWAGSVLLWVLAGPAVAGTEGFLCRHPEGGPVAWHFAIDEAHQAVSIDAPVNWTWMTRDSVLFLHYATIGGRQYATQTYTLDRRSGRFEVCDYPGGADQPVACDARWTCVPSAPPTLPGVVRSSGELPAAD